MLNTTVANMQTMSAYHRGRVNDSIQRLNQYIAGLTRDYLGNVNGVVKSKEEVEQGVTLGDALDRLEEQ